MAFKDILVHVDDLQPSAARLRAAINLAKTLDARLTGLYVKATPYYPPSAEVHISSQVLGEQAEKLDRAAERAEESFAAATGSNGLKVEWRTVEGDLSDVLSVQARYHDLTVVGQGNLGDNVFFADREMPDRLILTSGRPVLVIPYVGDYETIGRNVMIAWDAGPPATRAVHDALPLLKAAKKVSVMVINPKKGAYRQIKGTGGLPGADIAAHLAHHGVNAEADHVTSDMNPGDILLSQAADKSIDLMVMGAYGHWRWRELVLGGVTVHMLSHMTVPMLMSH